MKILVGLILIACNSFAALFGTDQLVAKVPYEVSFDKISIGQLRSNTISKTGTRLTLTDPYFLTAESYIQLGSKIRIPADSKTVQLLCNKLGYAYGDYLPPIKSQISSKTISFERNNLYVSNNNDRGLYAVYMACDQQKFEVDHSE